MQFDQITRALNDFADPEHLMAFLSDLAQKLIGVPELLKDNGCPDTILEFPATGFGQIPEKLQRFGVAHG